MRRLILFSGGLKSLFLTVLAKKEGTVHLLYLDDTSPTQRVAVLQAAEYLEVPLTILSIESCPPLAEPLLRLMFFILWALPTAHERSCKTIYYGLSRDDDPRVATSLEPFVKHAQAMIELAQPMYDGRGIWLGTVEVETPLRRLRREHVIRLGNQWNVAWEHSRSCSHPTANHCGQCFGCRRRRKAFITEGKHDPTLYTNIL